MLKKTIALLLALVICFSALAGCDTQETPADPTTTDREETTNTTAVTQNEDANEETYTDSLLNFFYMDVIQQQYATWQQTFGDSTDDYLKIYFGLDTSKALDLQIYSQADGSTWADYYTALAMDEAKSTLALCDAAGSKGYQLSEEAQGEFDDWVSTYDMYAQIYNITPDEFIAANYGEGTTFAGWKEYLRCVITAQDYAMAYADSLHFDENTLRKHETGREQEYNSYSFASYHLSYTKYPDLGSVAEDGNVSFDEQQKQAALKKAKEDADSLTAANSVEQLDQLISSLACNSGVEAASTVAEDTAYGDISEILRPWLTDPARKAGDCTVIANETATTNEDGTETMTLHGYYVVFFTGANDNKRPLANVRHLLVLFGEDEKAAEQEANDLYAQWKQDPSEENFIALVKENSDDTSAEYGGLFEDLAPNSPYVAEFLDWALDEDRVKGDCEVITTPYGYHLMYYVSDDETLYRDYLISQELEEAAYNEWYDGIVNSFTITFSEEDWVNSGYIISPAT